MHLLCVGALKSSFELHEMGDISQQVEFNEQTLFHHNQPFTVLSKNVSGCLVYYLIFNNLMSCIIFVALDEKDIEHG